jgi:hypothetical protein
MAKTIKLSEENDEVGDAPEATTIDLVVTSCSPYGKEGDVITVNVVDADSMIQKGFAKKG